MFCKNIKVSRFFQNYENMRIMDSLTQHQAGCELVEPRHRRGVAAAAGVEALASLVKMLHLWRLWEAQRREMTQTIPAALFHRQRLVSFHLLKSGKTLWGRGPHFQYTVLNCKQKKTSLYKRHFKPNHAFSIITDLLACFSCILHILWLLYIL